MTNLFCVLGIIGVALISVWLGIRSKAIGNRPLRWTGLAGSLLLTAVSILIATLMSIGMIKQRQRSAPLPEIKVTANRAAIERGANIANGFCSACHSEAGPMQGGLDLGKAFPLPLGSFVSPNLTPAGPLGHWSDAQVFRAIRNAIDADGRWLMIMSYTNTSKLSDDDIKAVIAYLRSLSAQGPASQDAPDHLSPIGLVMLGARQLPTGKPVFTSTITAPPRGPTAAYGKYLVSFADCRECHGSDLAGGVPKQSGPQAPGLGHVRTWTNDQFRATLRSGIDPYGHALATQMPWKSLGRFADDDLTAIYQFIVNNAAPSGEESRVMR